MMVVAAPNARTMSAIREPTLLPLIRRRRVLKANGSFDAPVTSATVSGGTPAFVLALLDELGVSY